MTVGIVGLGLIGGSFAKAYHEAGETVLACNRTEDTLRFAMLSGAVDGELTEENIGSCDLVIIAVFPEAAEALFEKTQHDAETRYNHYAKLAGKA